MPHIIFGASGFIAFHLRQHILSRYPADSILALDDKKKVTDDFTFCDVRKTITLTANSDSVIYNLAAIHVTPGYPDQDYFETNILGASNICDFARKNNIHTIVFTSSISPYGTSEDFKSEENIPMPNTPYGISKLTAEYIHKVWQAEDAAHRRLFIVRPGVVFGNHEGGNFTRLFNSLRKGYFFYPGRKDTVKAAVYVKDVARILYQAGQENPAGVVTYNISLSPAPTIEEICNTMAEVTHVKRPKLLVPGKILKLGATMAYYAARILGKKINGIHPDRVKKLMISTNVSGEKLSHSPYKLEYSLRSALEDWFNDCGQKGLF